MLSPKMLPLVFREILGLLIATLAAAVVRTFPLAVNVKLVLALDPLTLFCNVTASEFESRTSTVSEEFALKVTPLPLLLPKPTEILSLPLPVPFAVRMTLDASKVLVANGSG
jgi:hypothetical protein